MSERCLLPLGYEEFVTFTRNRDGRLTVHWPENARGTVIARELLDQMVGQLNERRWIPVAERLPEVGEHVLGWRPGWVRAAELCRISGCEWMGRHSERVGGVAYWMPLPAPPEVTP